MDKHLLSDFSFIVQLQIVKFSKCPKQAVVNAFKLDTKNKTIFKLMLINCS